MTIPNALAELISPQSLTRLQSIELVNLCAYVVVAVPSLIHRLPPRTIKIEGQQLVLSCLAEALPLPNVTWYINERTVSSGDDGRWEIRTTRNGTYLYSSLSVNSVRYDDAGQFSCVFKNYRGSIETTGTVVVQGIYIYHIILLLSVSFGVSGYRHSTGSETSIHPICTSRKIIALPIRMLGPGAAPELTVP